jgi:hypothetical protein
MSQISLGIRCFFFFFIYKKFKSNELILLRNQSKIKKKKNPRFLLSVVYWNFWCVILRFSYGF